MLVGEMSLRGSFNSRGSGCIIGDVGEEQQGSCGWMHLFGVAGVCCIEP